MRIRRMRTPESVKKRIDLMLKSGEVILDTGSVAYEFDHYEYEPATCQTDYISKLSIFYRDFDKNKSVRLYAVLTSDNLRRPENTDWFTHLVDCYWEKEYPTLLYMREFTSTVN